MHRLQIRNFDPIESCDIDVGSFEIFTGAQASGKSTIAKAIFFFRTIKDDILDLMMRRDKQYLLRSALDRQIRNKFIKLFGNPNTINSKMQLKYYYNTNTHITITLGGINILPADNMIYNCVEFYLSANISDCLFNNDKLVINTQTDKKAVIEMLNTLFSDDEETIFIPAGRSLITLLTTQLNYIFTSMDDEQKRSIDFCTQKYIERILRIRESFRDGIDSYLERKLQSSLTPIDTGNSRDAIRIIDKILKGKYLYTGIEERLMLDSDRFVRINYSSSGQQETVWIFNILMYQLINNIKTFVILEEPEAHLYPDAQKDISELLAMFKNSGNSVLITTHSPYVLGAINNLLYAQLIRNGENSAAIDMIVDLKMQLDGCGAYFVQNGTIQSCIDDELGIISNEVIDGASEEINAAFDRLLEIEGGEA